MLFPIVERALNLEGIAFKILRYENTHHVSVIIQNWKNYLKCWQTGLFNRCIRKKNLFLKVARNSTVYAVVDPSDLKRLSEKYTQRELANLVSSWQGNVCRMLQGKILLSLKQIRLLEGKGLTFSIKSLRMGNLTVLPYSNEIRELYTNEFR